MEFVLNSNGISLSYDLSVSFPGLHPRCSATGPVLQTCCSLSADGLIADAASSSDRSAK